LFLGFGWGGAASAAPGAGGVDVIEVSGRIDPLVKDFIGDSLRRAERAASVALVIQLDSGGTLLSAGELDGLASELARARVPVAVWIGPSGARAARGAVRLVRAAAVTGIAPGSHLGSLPAARAVSRHAVDTAAPTLGDFIVGLDGRNVAGRTLSTARVVRRGNLLRREPAVEVRFAKLGLLPRLLHTVASPSVAYLLFVVGLLLLVFEFFTAGVGVAGATGAGCLVLAAYGLTVLPATGPGVALVLLGMFGFAVDVQTGAPRVWTVIGAAALATGSWRLYHGQQLSWLTAVPTMVGVVLFMLAAMPAVVRARFSAPTIGRESMIGEVGEAAAALAPDGMVRVRDGLWQARTNRATPIAAGEPVRVVAVEGLLLEVERTESDRP